MSFTLNNTEYFQANMIVHDVNATNKCALYKLFSNFHVFRSVHTLLASKSSSVTTQSQKCKELKGKA